MCCSLWVEPSFRKYFKRFPRRFIGRLPHFFIIRGCLYDRSDARVDPVRRATGGRLDARPSAAAAPDAEIRRPLARQVPPPAAAAGPLPPVRLQLAPVDAVPAEQNKVHQRAIHFTSTPIPLYLLLFIYSYSYSTPSLLLLLVYSYS